MWLNTLTYFFFNDTATTEIYTLSLHDALPISYIKDKKRVIPCASLCEGEFGINGYFIGVPSVIGANGVEKILEFELTDDEIGRAHV